MAGSESTLARNSRLYLLGIMLVFWCALICARLVYLQIFCYGSFVKQAEHQQQRAIPLAAKRGVIYDRYGRELSMSVLVDSAFAVPTEVKDLPTAVSLISRITGEDANVVLADCRAHKTFCWVARKADDETIERIKSLNLQGIHFEKEPKRFYPARDLAAQVLGSVGMEDTGQSGIEHEFDDELRGRPGKMFISVDARRQWFSDVETQPEPGENIVLTIDKNIQYIAEKELDQAMHDTQAIAGTVIVENPHTGEILALANRPTFNPNSRKQITPAALTDRAVSDIYEPGSTFKLVTISAALEEKLTNPDEVFDCQMGSIVYNGMRIRDSRPHGLLPVWGVLAESSDVGAIKIAREPRRPYRQQSVRPGVANAHTVVDDRSHLTVERFIGIREFLFQRGRYCDQFESRSGLVDIAHRAISERRGSDVLARIGIERRATGQRQNLAGVRVSTMTVPAIGCVSCIA